MRNFIMCLTIMAAIFTLANSCSWFDKGPVDDKPNFEIWYTIDGNDYHARKKMRHASIIEDIRRAKIPLDEYPYEELNPCEAPDFFQDQYGRFVFKWQLHNPLQFVLVAFNDTSYHFITRESYPIYHQHIHFAKEYAPEELSKLANSEENGVEILDSLSIFKFDKNNKDGLFISFELALKVCNQEKEEVKTDTIYIKNGYVEAHPNRNGFFVWDVSNHIYDE